MTDRAELDPRFLAAVDLIRRSGARQIQIRYSDDEEPTVWFVVAQHYVVNGRPVGKGGEPHWETAAALDPFRAAFRLCETLIDGGFCVHCKRPTGVSEDLDPLPAESLICWYVYDPELKTFRRGCEGDT